MSFAIKNNAFALPLPLARQPVAPAGQSVKFRARLQDPPPDMPRGWAMPEVRQRIENMMRNGKFRYKPEVAEEFLERLQTLCENCVPSRQLFEALRDYIRNSRKTDKAVSANLSATEQERIERRVAQVLQLLKDQKSPVSLLDIGCGSGKITAALAQALKLKRDQAIGVDLFYPKTANLAFRFIPLDGKHIPLRTNSVDLATLFAVLHHADDPMNLLKEAHRILKEDGRLVVREFDAADEALYEFNLLMDHLLYEVFDETPDMPIPGHYFTAEKWQRLFEEAGFAVEKIERPEPTNPFNPFLSVLKKKPVAQA